MFCPNINNKEVLDGFNEMVQAFGGQPLTEDEFKSSSLRNQRTGLDYSAMVRAYNAYNQNNGNFLDKTPSGQPSKLFQQILQQVGDVRTAILLKSSIYSNKFQNAYGKISLVGEPSYNQIFKSVDESLNKIQQDFKLVTIDLFKKQADQQLTSDMVLKRLADLHVLSSWLAPLLKLMQIHELPILLSTIEGNRFMATRTDENGNSYIVIDPHKAIGVTQQYFAEKLLHEVSHAITVPIIDNPKTFRQRRFAKLSKAVYQQLKDIFYVDGMLMDYSSDLNYAFSSEKEFVAEFLVNENVRNKIYSRVRRSKNKSIVQNLKEFINQITRAFVGENLFNTQLSQVLLLEKQLKNILYNSEKIQYNQSDIKAAFDSAYENINESVANIEGYDAALDAFLKQSDRFQTNYAPQQHEYSSSAMAEVDRVFKKIQDQLSIRLKAIDNAAKRNSNLNDASVLTRDQLVIAQSAGMSPAEKIVTLIKPMLPQINQDLDVLREQVDKHQIISAEEYNYQMHDNISVYEAIVDQIKKLAQNRSSGVVSDMQQELGESGYKSLIQFINELSTTITSAKNILEEHRNLQATKILLDIGENTGAADIVEIADQVNVSARYDTNKFIKTFGFIAGAKDPVLRAIGAKITSAINSAEDATRHIGNRLLQLQHKLKFGDKVTDLYERLSDGSFSQNLIRKLNFGQLQKDYEDEMKRLQSKYELTDSELLYGPQDEEKRKQFFKEKNKWLEDHTIRRYKAKYYEAFQNLSPKTQAARREIQAKINEYRRMCTDEESGRPDYSKLTNEQWEELETLRQQKKALASLYDEFGNMKTGDPLKIATEIQALNKALYGQSDKRSTNQQQWLADREKIIEQCGGREKYEANSEDFDFEKLEQWDRRNSKQVLKFDRQKGKSLLELYIDEEAGEVVYEVITDKGSDGGELYRKNSEKINALLAPYRNNFGEIGMFKQHRGDVLPKSIIAEVSALQSENARIRRLAIKRAKKTKDQLFLDTIKKRKELREKLVTYGASKAYKDLANYYYSQYPDNLDLANTIIDNKTRKVIYKFSDGALETSFGSLHTWYTKTIVKPEFFDQFAEMVPNDNYLDDSVKSELIDHRFDEWEDQGEYMVPRTDTPELKQRYDNSKQFDKIDKREGNTKFSQGLYDLYNEALRVIHDSNQRYGLNGRSNYLLPGITASNLDTLFYRDYKTSKAIRYIKKNWFGFREREDTTVFGEKSNDQIEKSFFESDDKQLLRADGTELRMVPRFYSNKLKDTFAVSRNLIEILARYDKQSRLFEERGKIQSEIQLLLDVAKDKYAPEGKDKGISTTYQVAKKHVDMRLYDIKTTTDPKFARLAALLNQATSAINLGFNKAVAYTGFFTTSVAHLINSLVGSKYSTSDVFWASWECAKYVATRLFGAFDAENSNSSNKIIKLMELFDLGGQYESKIKNSSDARLLRLFKQNYIWGMLRLQDNAVKMSIMISTLHSFRIVDKEFITKEGINRKYWKDENVRDTKLEEYKYAENLYDLLYVNDDGDIQIDPKYQQQYDKIKDFVRNRVLTYSENADGIATPSQKAAITTSFWGQAILMHRQYFPLMLQERYGETVYNAELGQYQGGIFRNAGKLLFNSYVNMYQRLTKQNNKPITWSAEAAMNCALICGTLTFQFGMPIFIATSLFSAIAGAINGEYYNKNFKAHKNKESSEADAQLSITRQYQLSQIRMELLITQALIFPLATLLTALADDDDNKDNALLQFWAYVAARVQWEAFNPYRFTDAVQQFHSLTAVTGTLDAIQKILNEAGKIASPHGDLLNTLSYKVFNDGDDMQQESDGWIFTDVKQRKSGTYSKPIPVLSDILDEDIYFTKLGQFLFEITPFSNTYKQSINSKRSRQYYRNQVMQDYDYKEDALYQIFDSELVDPINEMVFED